MRKQLNFFMGDLEEQEFLHLASRFYDKKIDKSTSQIHFGFGDEHIQFLRSEKKSDIVTAGRIAISTKGKSENIKNAENAYRKLERWIKANFTNELTCKNINIVESTSSVSDVWLSFSLLSDWENKKIVLRQSLKGSVIFEPKRG